MKVNLSAIYIFLRKAMLPLEEIDQSLPTSGTIYDLGCGQGLIAKYLSAKRKRNIIGVDLNEKRLQEATARNIKFEKNDILKVNLRQPSGVILSDVLHHIPYKNQDALLQKIAQSLKKNGILVIKEIDENEKVRSILSRFWDFVFYPKDKIYYRDSTNFTKNLTELRFTVQVRRTIRWYPGSTTLFICKKKK